MRPTDEHTHAGGGGRAAERPTDHRGRYVPDGSWPPRAGARRSRWSGCGASSTPPTRGVRRRPLRDLGVVGGVAGKGGLRPAEGHRARERTRAVLLGDAVRELAIANHEGGAGEGGRSHAAEAHRLLDGLARDLPLVVRFSPEPALVPLAAGVDEVLSRLVATLHDAMVAGTWPRLKACRNSHCRWAFYDHSHNGWGTWCSELACGSRMKVRAYRAGQTAGRDTDGARPGPRTRTIDEARPPGGPRHAPGHGGRRRRVWEQQRRDRLGGAAAGPEGTFCQVVLAWSNAGVGTVNHFSRISPDSGRRREPPLTTYLEAWTGYGAISPGSTRRPTGRPPRPRPASTRPPTRSGPRSRGARARASNGRPGLRVRLGPERHAVRIQREVPRHRLPHARPAPERARRAGGAPGVRPPDRAGHAPGRHPTVMAAPAGGPSASRACVGSGAQASTSTTREWRGP